MNWPRCWGTSWSYPASSPAGKASWLSWNAVTTSVRRTGPESLRHFKRTYVQALRRQIATGSYDPLRPRVVPVADDKRYRSWSAVPQPLARAAVIYLMDVSGSMTDQQKRLVRTAAFWIDTWLQSQYDGVQRRFIIHDAAAREVDEQTFYHTRESGGTRISSAYQVCQQVIDESFPPAEWNIYAFQFSDGDNWGDDNKQCLRMLREDLLPKLNLFCYGQVESPYGSGDFLKTLRNKMNEEEKLIVCEIPDQDAIMEALKTFLGTGK